MTNQDQPRAELRSEPPITFSRSLGQAALWEVGSVWFAVHSEKEKKTKKTTVITGNIQAVLRDKTIRFTLLFVILSKRFSALSVKLKPLELNLN